MPGQRLFLGLPVPSDVSEQLANWATQELDSSLFRCVPAENLHVTLIFFGERNGKDAETIANLVRQVEWSPLRIQIGPLIFYSRSAVASKLVVDMGALDDLNKRLGWGQYRFVLDADYAANSEGALSDWTYHASKPLGRLCHKFTTVADLERRRRRHRHSQPLDLHVTLARLRKGAHLPPDLPTPPNLSFVLDRAVLFENKLGPDGSSYFEVAESRR